MRQEKQLLLDEIKDKIERSNGFVAVSYQQFTSTRAREFRNIIADIGGEFEVVPKRVFVKAAETVGIKFDVSTLHGHVGVIFAETDAFQIAKKAVTYGKENDEVVTVLGGHIEGEVCSAEEVKAIATLPSLQELRAQFVGLLEAPMAQTVQVFQAALTGVLYCLEEKSKK